MSLLEGIAGTVLLAAAGAGCAAPVELGPAADSADFRRALPDHREIQEATISAAGRTVSLVAHLSVERAGEIRVHLGSEGGLTGMDVGVRGDRVTVHARSALLDAEGLEARIAADLVRVYGDRSLFCPAAGAGKVLAVARTGDLALPLPDGSWLTAPAADLAPGSARVRVRLLDPRRIPEADLLYGDFGEDGIPRSVRIEDLRDGHVVGIEVVEVLPPPGAPR